MKHYDAAVVGAGVGGLAAALLLASNGKKVALFDKNNRPGGRLGSASRDGFTLDFGVHLISRGEKGPLIQLLEHCGVEVDVEFTKVRPVQCTGGERFKFPHDLKGRVPDADFEGVCAMIAEMKDMTDEETAALDDITLEEHLSSYTTNQFVHSCVSAVGEIYCCIPLFRLAAGEFARCLKWEAACRASGYPSGGCMSITNNYIKGLVQYGADLYMGTKVEKVLVEDGRAVGVVAGGEEYRADCVVSNGDFRPTVTDLVGAEYFPPEYVEYAKGLEYTNAGIVVRFALDTVISSDIKMLSNFSTMDVHEYSDSFLRGDIPEEINDFIVVPSSFDPSVAPEGKQLVMIATNFPYKTDPSLYPAIADAMIRSAEQYFPGLQDHALFVEKAYPTDADKLFGEGGAGIGIATQVGQAGASRPSVKTPIEGLFIVGAEAGGTGVGTEMCANSAIEFYDSYAAQYGEGCWA